MTDPVEQLAQALADRYKIERELGAGGMATVYLCEDVKHHRKVAVKVLRPELAAVLGADRFVHEIETTANLQHPHILPLFDSGEADGFLYYVMPYIDGETLRDKLNRETQLSVDQAVQITTEVADALAYAHRCGVIHRDIKPENILLHDGRPMVADFGIALAVSEVGGARLTETGLSLGTPQYMSPEQATGDRDVDARSDVYSLGCVVYEMLVGTPPHVGSSSQAIIASVLTEIPASPRDARPTVRPNIDAAVRCALEKLPADRFPSAADFITALVDPAFAIPGYAGTTDGVRAVRWSRISITTATVAVMSLVVAAWGWLRPSPKGPVRWFNIGLTEETRFMRFGPALALSPSGESIVYVRGDDAQAQLWLKTGGQLDARPIAGTLNAYAPFFSPDGRYIGFSDEYALKIVSSNGGPAQTISNEAGGFAAWGRDGYIYTNYPCCFRGLARVHDTGGPLDWLTTVDTTAREFMHTLPDPLPSGRGVLFTIMHVDGDPTEHRIAVLDLNTRVYRRLANGVLGRYAASGHIVVTQADGTVLAAPFDQRTLTMTGQLVALFDGVRLKWGRGFVDLSIATNGTLAYVGTKTPLSVRNSTLSWVNRDGSSEPFDPEWRAEFDNPAISPEGTRLAITVREGENTNIWIKTLTGGPPQRLTFAGTRNEHASWTADGQSVTFTSNRNGGMDLWTKRADGGSDAVLTLDVDDNIAESLWSSDGRWLVYQTEPGIIYGVRFGTDTVSLRVTSEPRALQPSLSPDGRFLAYWSNYNVFVVRFPNTGNTKWQVSSERAFEPLWSRGGDEIYYRASSRMTAVEVQRTATFASGAQRILFSSPNTYKFSPTDRQYDVTLAGDRFLMVREPGFWEDAGDMILVENFFEELKTKVGT